MIEGYLIFMKGMVVANYVIGAVQMMVQ